MADPLPETMTESTTEATLHQTPVVVKKYANRRLYNTETSSYITLDNLADMIRAGRDFVVYDAKSSEDITRGVLTQIIVEEESKGSSLLPTSFLRQLIGFYGGNLQSVVPNYLETAMSTFALQQQQMRQVVQKTFGPFIPASVEEIGRQNIAMIERAMSMFNPFHRGGEAAQRAAEPAGQKLETKPGEAQASVSASVSVSAAELDAMRHEIESLRAQLAIARAEAVLTHVVPTASHETNVTDQTPAVHVVADPPPPALPAPPAPATVGERKTRSRKG